MRRLLQLFITGLVVIGLPMASVAMPFHMLVESDPGGANNLNYASFNSVTDLLNFNTSGVGFLPSLAPAVSVAGLAHDGTQFHMLVESDPGGANNLNYASFNSVTDLLNFNTSGVGFLPSLAPAVSVAGLAHDGTQFHMLVESDPGGANNLNYASFNSVTDLLNFNTSGVGFLPSLAPAVSVAGLAHDGTQFHMLVESDPGGANNLNYASFNSVTDLLNFNTSGVGFLPSLAPAVSVAGFAAGIESSSNPIPEPSTMLLFGTGLVGLATWRWKRGTQA